MFIVEWNKLIKTLGIYGGLLFLIKLIESIEKWVYGTTGFIDAIMPFRNSLIFDVAVILIGLAIILYYTKKS